MYNKHNNTEFVDYKNFRSVKKNISNSLLTIVMHVISEIIFNDTPKFSDRMDNLTVTVGRDAILECVVESLSTYKVRISVRYLQS